MNIAPVNRCRRRMEDEQAHTLKCNMVEANSTEN